MPGRVVRRTVPGVAAVAVIWLSGCSAPAPPSSEVEQQAASLADVAAPGPGWTRADTAVLGSTAVGSSPRFGSEAGADIAYLSDRDGVVTYAYSGWTRTVGPAGVREACGQAQHWVATAGDTYDVVSSRADVLDSCLTLLELGGPSSSEPPGGLTLECSPAVVGQVSTCIRLDAAVTPAGDLQLITTVAKQA
jgi:hypothetical protein